MPFGDYEFRENQHTETHTLLGHVDEFLSTFIVLFGCDSVKKIYTHCGTDFVTSVKIGTGKAVLVGYDMIYDMIYFLNCNWVATRLQ